MILPVWLDMSRRNNSLKSIAVVVACVSIGAVIPRYLTHSPTNSLAQHWFVLERGVTASQIKQKDIVRFPLDDAVTQKAIHELGISEAHLLKRVGCVQGQALNVNEQKEYYCDGDYLGRAKDKTLAGAVAKNFVWNSNVPQGKFFAIADHIDSYDSRYFGFVDISKVEAKAYPLF